MRRNTCRPESGTLAFSDDRVAAMRRIASHYENCSATIPLSGVYGMLGIGLAMMAFMSLVPAGIYQAWAS